ncbi:MAG TPA: MASE1 domain-containing protein [Gemmatimonadales bacterium]|nr:MASE1 domain-containing protein [Gemmatimonadales bacterium]
MIPRSLFARVAVLAAVVVAYVVAGKLGLRLAFFHPSATPVWPTTGLAIAALLVMGPWLWPGVFVGAFLVNVTTAGSVATSLGIALGNTLEAVVGAQAVTKLAGGRKAFDRAAHVAHFALVAALASTTISATIGVTSLALSGFASWSDFGWIWLTWWSGNATGALIVTPPLVLWANRPTIKWSFRQAAEGVALFGVVALTGAAAFGGLPPVGASAYPLEIVTIPPFIWAALRFGRRVAATAVLLLSGIAVWGTLHGLGPFVRESPNASLLLLQAFMGVVALTTMVLASSVAERRKIEATLRDQAVRDPLTHLANYRHLREALDAELRRSDRTERPFAVLLLDMDDLKKINDRHGHLVGSGALSRVADALRASCRNIDLPARFGGDEFAVVLPETDEGAARAVAARIQERVASDGRKPALSVSVGVALFPCDGKTVEQLLAAADGDLYRAKARRRTA